ncbi:MAG: hypothetical protein PHQ34_05730 [Methanothrix sp.]|nr:hypothetical protein [Methanothrix sp.]
MRMQKEEKIVVVLLLMALGSLAVAFWAFAPDSSDQDSSFGSESQKDVSSSTSIIEGRILQIKPTRSGGNLLIELEGSETDIFVPAKSGAKELLSRIKAGDRLSVRGTVSSYQGSEELVVSSPTDVQVLAT